MKNVLPLILCLIVFLASCVSTDKAGEEIEQDSVSVTTIRRNGVTVDYSMYFDNYNVGLQFEIYIDGTQYRYTYTITMEIVNNGYNYVSDSFLSGISNKNSSNVAYTENPINWPYRVNSSIHNAILESDGLDITIINQINEILNEIIIDRDDILFGD